MFYLFRFRHSDYGWLFPGKDPGVRCCINILLLLTAVMMLYSAFKYSRFFRKFCTPTMKNELDLPDEIRAKTVRRKPVEISKPDEGTYAMLMCTRCKKKADCRICIQLP